MRLGRTARPDKLPGRVRGTSLNSYDALAPDVAALLSLPSPPPDLTASRPLAPHAIVWELLRLGAQGLAQWSGLHKRLVYANLRLDWFHEFRAYWCGVLGGRPIHPLDFGYLLGVYRARGQDITAWDDPRLIYTLFTYTYRMALQPLRVRPFVRWIPRHASVLEYGCGAAPMLTGLARYYRRLDLRLYGTDLPHVLFHFARWKFRNDPNVHLVPLPAPLMARFDVIFATEVLEHVPSPLQTVRDLHEMLMTGGALIYDFAETDGQGLDSPTAQAERPAVQGFVAAHFRVEDRVGGVVVARKL